MIINPVERGYGKKALGVPQKGEEEGKVGGVSALLIRQSVVIDSSAENFAGIPNQAIGRSMAQVYPAYQPPDSFTIHPLVGAYSRLTAQGCVHKEGSLKSNAPAPCTPAQ
jgi:hypothetical protein